MRDGYNPYAVAFGRIPTSYINRDIIVDEIVRTFNSEYVDSQCFKLTGIRGSGKTVTMTTISKQLQQDEKWIIVDLSSSNNLLIDTIAALYDKVEFLSQFIDMHLNLTAFGLEIGVEKNKPAMSLEVTVEKIMNIIKKNGKKLLITIDEIVKNDETIHFIKFFQRMVRNELPIYLIAAGLHGKIEELENTEGLTFFLRAEKRKMEPLNYTLIREDYKKKLGLKPEIAEQLATMTKGYAFAYQALGKYMWELEADEITDEVLLKMDAALADGAYRIIWRELTETERFYISYISQKDKMDVSELLEMTKKQGSDWSRPRKSLLEKELISSEQRGVISFSLPRFYEFICNYCI